MKSYRYYYADSPMSDWGHAMFCDDRKSVERFGDTLYTVQSCFLIDIRVYISAFNLPESFNPKHIATDAEAWDNYSMTRWFIDNIAIPQHIRGIKTRDGAVVFDRKIIRKEN